MLQHRSFSPIYALIIPIILLPASCNRQTSVPTETVAQRPLPAALKSDELRESIIDSFEKRVMGRTASYPDGKRIIAEISPIIQEALSQPFARNQIRKIARDYNWSFERAKQEWLRYQEADILLESGGNPDAISISNACGVAQFLAGTATRNGLKVDSKTSAALTAKIRLIEQEMIVSIYTPEQSAKRTKELEALKQERRRIDERFDPRKALFSQTRYLLWMYDRFPSIDWVYQAYHGGENGVRRTLQTYLGTKWRGSTASAIRYGYRPGLRLTYERFYLDLDPTRHPKAFGYIFSRTDEHRWYWWKLLSARRMLEAMRKDPEAFHERWQQLKPGSGKPNLWYPDIESLLVSAEALEDEIQAGRLVRLQPSTTLSVFSHPSVLRPETYGALKLISIKYQRIGATGPLKLASALETERMDQNAGEEINIRQTGLAMELLQPTDAGNRKRLEWGLSYWSDRQVIYWQIKHYPGGKRYLVIPNPAYAEALQVL